MASFLPIFSRQRLSHLTDSGITNLLDTTSLLSQVRTKDISPDHVGYTIRVDPNAAQLVGDDSQGLIGRYATADKVQFVYTKTSDQSGLSDTALENLQVYFSNSNGTFQVEQFMGQLANVSYTFGPDLKGTASVSAISDKRAQITYSYTVYAKDVLGKTTTFDLEPQPVLL